MGVVREVLKEGTGRSPKHAECCVLHYIGTFASNGREFDNSRRKGKPLTFLVGIGSVIQGWDVGVAQMKLGEIARLTISADFGYGAEGVPGVPPGSELVFEVELLQIGNDKAGGGGSYCMIQ
mmetsp:Transcript_22785/g.36651  ORF Transcript_22785/g.36651 Transcript_22785/m.36651 type:complete len:122 (-) Transcript_22785:39-404(-)